MFVPRHPLIALFYVKGFEPIIFDQKSYSSLHTTKKYNSSLQRQKNFTYKNKNKKQKIKKNKTKFPLNIFIKELKIEIIINISKS